ncbi:hypothetical protein [Lysobacter humi (ex Lee et al. 2017)]
MRRLSLCLLILIVSASVGAREVKLCGPNGAGGANESVARPAASRKASPAREAGGQDARSRPTVHSDVSAAPRTRWHSFLPGMFR